MLRRFSAISLRFTRDRRGTTAIEYALILPVLLLLSFGILEMSLYMAADVTLEGGLKQASRYGITSQNPGSLTAQQLANVPTAFNTGDPRTEMIGLILYQNTFHIVNLNNATISTQVFSSFSVAQNGEPYTDLNNNGQYDAGEPYSDMNCNGVRDGPGASGAGVGAAGNIVVYTVTYNWPVLTPLVGQFLGKPDPNNAGRYIIPMKASIVVKNEPDVAGSSFCS
jgi:Flp pilus assembly protein TadG